jgi:hypothetical protein
LSRKQLPTTVSEEIEIMEEKIRSVFDGKFSRMGFGFSSIKIDWVDGEWHFTILDWDQQTVKISGGESNSLGLPGGQLFLFSGRSVTIDEFKIDLLEREVTFHGKCSSSKDSLGRKFKSSLCFAPNSLLGIMESKILVEHSGKVKVSKRALRNEKEKIYLGDILLFMQQQMISPRGGVEPGSSADEAD